MPVRCGTRNRLCLSLLELLDLPSLTQLSTPWWLSCMRLLLRAGDLSVFAAGSSELVVLSFQEAPSRARIYHVPWKGFCLSCCLQWSMSCLSCSGFGCLATHEWFSFPFTRNFKWPLSFAVSGMESLKIASGSTSWDFTVNCYKNIGLFSPISRNWYPTCILFIFCYEMQRWTKIEHSKNL